MDSNPTDQERRHILVVDDIASVIRLLQLQLTLDGFAVEGVEVDQARQAIDKQKPDLILLEVILPGLSGYDLLQDIKRTWPELPVVFLTTEHNEGDRALAFDLGADDYVTKPFDPDELGKRISDLLDQPARPRLVLRRDDLIIDFTRKLARRGNHLIALTVNEWALMLTLASHSDERIPTEVLLTSVWGPNDSLSPNRMGPLIASIRRNLEVDAENPVLVVGTIEEGFVLKGPLAREKR